jgi:Ca-activated chloride channel family protein
VSFQWPLALLGLLVVPVLLALYIRRERRRQQDAARFTTPALLPNLVDAAPGWRRHVPLALLLAALTAMLVGVARPHADMNVPREEAAVILAIDTSLSMTADDVKPTRLEAARRAAQAFIEQVPEKFRVGVIGFSGRAAIAVPPTDDRELTRAALKSLRPGEGTSLGDAVALGVRLARRERDRDGKVPPTAILVISDGAQMSGQNKPETAAERARRAQIPVYTALIGTPDGVITVALEGGFQAQIRVPTSPETLQIVARLTGGRFFTAPNDPRLREIHERLGSRLGHRRESREITDLFAGGSAALLLVGGALSALWFRRVP